MSSDMTLRTVVTITTVTSRKVRTRCICIRRRCGSGCSAVAACVSSFVFDGIDGETAVPNLVPPGAVVSVAAAEASDTDTANAEGQSWGEVGSST